MWNWTYLSTFWFFLHNRTHLSTNLVLIFIHCSVGNHSKSEWTLLSTKFHDVISSWIGMLYETREDTFVHIVESILSIAETCPEVRKDTFVHFNYISFVVMRSKGGHIQTRLKNKEECLLSCPELRMDTFVHIRKRIKANMLFK